MPASTSGSLTTAGSVTLSKATTDTMVVCAIDGTYGTVTFVFEGSVDSTNYFPLAAIAYSTGAVVTGTISPADNAELCYKIPSEGLVNVRLRATAVGSGTLGVTLQSGSFVGQPFVSVSSTTGTSVSATTFSGDVTLGSGADLAFSGTTGQSQITLTDNLADALSVCESSTDYVVFVTTDSGEKVQVAQDLYLTGGKDLYFSGTTGQCEVQLTNSLNDALSIAQSSTDFLVFNTSTAGITVGQHLTMADAKNIILNTTTGTKIGTATSQKLGFYNATPVVQYNTTGDQTTGAAGSTTNVFLNTTFTGGIGSTAYKVGDIVAALKTLGLIAS